MGTGDGGALGTEERAAIAAGWQQAIGEESFVPLSEAALREALDGMAARVSAILGAEPVDRATARAVGRELGQLGYVRGESFGRMLEILAELAPDTVQRSTLRAVFGELTSGFASSSRGAAVAQHRAAQRAADIERAALERALEGSEARYRAVVAQANEGIALVDPRSGRILESNGAFQRLLGYGEAELIDMPLHDIIAHDRSSVDENLRRAARKGSFSVDQRRYRRKGGELITIEGSSTIVTTDRGDLLCLVVRDITERLRVSVELDEATRALATVREEERGRLARDIHDDAVQELAALRYQLASSRRRIAIGRPTDDAAMEIKQVERRLARVIGQLRELIAELRPTGLDVGGFGAALANYMSGLLDDRRPKEVTMDMSANAPSWPEPVALCLFRVAQEAIRNAVAHGGAQNVLVRTRARAGGVLLHVSDDGVGFAVPTQLSTLAHAQHFGLMGMAERVAEAGGRLRVRSRPGHGTVVIAWVPLVASQQEGELSDTRRAG